MRRFGLIVIGDEILSGLRSDAHLANLIGLLKQRGLSLSWAHYLGDERSEIINTLKRTFASGDIVFSTGGIGATPDDHTRQSAAAALDVPLRLHPQARELILQRIAQTNPELSDEEIQLRLKMGEFPQGAEIIPNPYNQIPGFSIREHYFCPGFPIMTAPMIATILDTHYQSLFHADAQDQRSLLVFEIAEASLTPLMERIEAEFAGIKVFSLPSVEDPNRCAQRRRRHIELGVKGAPALVPQAYAALKAGVEFFTRDILE